MNKCASDAVFIAISNQAFTFCQNVKYGKVQYSNVAYTLHLSPPLHTHLFPLFCLFFCLLALLLFLDVEEVEVSACKHVVQLWSELGLPHSERVVLPFFV